MFEIINLICLQLLAKIIIFKHRLSYEQIVSNKRLTNDY